MVPFIHIHVCSEALADNSSFEQAPAAALLLSRLNFHLGDHDRSVVYALRAGDAFNIEERSQFVETILSAILDRYTQSRVTAKTDSAALLERGALEVIFERVVHCSLRDRQFRQLIGMALDCRRLDILEAAVKAAASPDEAASLLYYARQVASTQLSCAEFRAKATAAIISLFSALSQRDHVFICDCLIAINQPDQVAQVIAMLAEREETRGEALQIAFNVQADAPQDFLHAVRTQLPADATTAEALSNILSGALPSRLHLEFLCRANHADPLILDRTKTSLNPQMSLHHQALSCANGFMQAGTTNDDFLRKNLDFLSHASNWAKFSASASLGAIHRGQHAKGRDLLSAYLPRPGVASSAYSEGGALLALGLIHANHGDDALPYLLEQLAATQSEIVQHGACLALGVAGMGSRHGPAIEAVKGILYGDNAVAGEAAGIALGLLMLGSGDAAVVEEMCQYAHESQHEKIIRSLAVGMALVMLGCLDRAEPLIARLESDKDPILRYGAVWTVALAFVGTSSNTAVQRLLHFAVSDANDDVRRAAVTALGFILFRTPDELPRLVELLTESYNPSVRHGAAMALGITFAGTANKRALDLVLPMCRDMTDHVRQGAFIARAMILMQHNDASADGQVSTLRTQLEQVASARHEDQLAKFGAILAQGILDAGGRNVRLALATPSGHVSAPGVTGLALFCQFWHWYPLAHLFSLALAPTALIALTPTLAVPRLAVISHAPASLFAYPEATKPTTAALPKKIVTAVLSTTAKAAARAKKNLPTSESKMSIDAEETEGSVPMHVDASAPAPAPALPESNFQTLDNLTRVVAAQVHRVQFPATGRFQPVSKKPWNGAIVIVRDERPTEPCDVMDVSGVIGVSDVSEPSPKPDASKDSTGNVEPSIQASNAMSD